MSEKTPIGLECPVPASATDVIELGHGSGGLMTRRLIDGLFRPAFGTGPDALTHDGATFDIGGARLAFTTDTYVVRPIFFPGSDIGALAVNGTVNDLAMCGAEPLYVSAGFVLEEGFPIADLRRVADSMRAAADAAGVRLVTGDTKVVENGKGDGIYINTSGVGRVVSLTDIHPRQVRAGDVVILSGDIGRHGIAVMAAREGLGFETEIESDCAPLWSPVLALIEANLAIHCLRDLTRGGLATALIEIAETARVDIRLDEPAIPVTPPVRGACEILGLDPLYVANEGRFVAVVPHDAAEQAIAILTQFNGDAAIIGHVDATTHDGTVSIRTIGGDRVLDMLIGEQLPRIC